MIKKCDEKQLKLARSFLRLRHRLAADAEFEALRPELEQVLARGRHELVFEDFWALLD